MSPFLAEFIGTMLLVNADTKESVTVPSILNVDRMLQDVKGITDSGRRKIWTAAQVALSVLRNLKAEGIPGGLSPWSVIKIMDGHTGGKLGLAVSIEHPRLGNVGKKREATLDDHLRLRPRNENARIDPQH